MPAAEDRPQSQPQRLALLGALVLVSLAAAWARCANWAGVFKNGEVFFPGLDSHYHLRRLQHTLADYPHVPDFDAWCNYPEGARQVWAKGPDLALATVGKLVQLVDDDPLAIEQAAALFGPVVGVIVCLLVFVLGRRLGGRLAGLVAALLAAVLPALSGYANLGRVDHHAAEPLLVVVPLWLLLTAFEAPSARRARRRAAVAGAALALSLGVWSGAIVVGAMAFASLGLVALAGWGPTKARCAAVGERAFGVATLVALPLCAWHPWMVVGSFDYFALSWFQPLCFAIAWGTLAAVRWARDRRGWRLAALGITPLGLGGLAVIALGGLRKTLGDALGYLGRGETQISQVTESLPLLEPGWGIATDLYSPLLLFVVVPLVYPALRMAGWRRQPLAEPQRTSWALALLWLTATAVLAFGQMRFGSLFAPLYCVWWGVVAAAGYRWLGRRSRRRWVPGGLLGVALAAVVAPLVPQHLPTDFSGTEQFVRSYDALVWLRRHGASPGDVADPGGRPAHAVMARWQWGHWLNYLAHQANIANPLGQAPRHIEGVARSARFFLTRDPQAAMTSLDRLGARYVLVAPLLDELEGMAAHTPVPAQTFRGASPSGEWEVLPAYYETVNTRLLYFDGLAMRVHGVRLEPLRGLALVYESVSQGAELGRGFAYAKVFERVDGAELRGVARPGASIVLAVPIRTNTGRRFVYRDQTFAAADGGYAVRVPYGLDPGAAVTALGAYELRLAGEVVGRAAVKRTDVLAGTAVAVVAP